MLNDDRVQHLLDEAEADLARYEALRENTLELIAAYKKRLALLGSNGRILVLPGVENHIVPKPPENDGAPLPPRSNKDIFLAVLSEFGQPMKAKDVWDIASTRGAQSNSSNPARNTDTILREMVRQGRIEQVGPGMFAAK